MVKMEKTHSIIMMFSISSLAFVMTLNLVIAADYEYLWTDITDPNSSFDQGKGVAVDGSGNVYVAGYCTDCGSSGGNAIYTMKLDSNGNHLWTNVTDPTTGSDYGYDVAVDGSDNVYVTGYCTGCGSSGGKAIYTMKLDSNGNHLWTNITDPTSNDGGSGIAVDSSGNVYVTGYCYGCGTSGAHAIYTMKLDTNGNHLWTNVTDPASGYDGGEDVAVDDLGNIYVTGRCDGCGSTGGVAIYTMKLDSNGNHLWTNVTDPTSGSDVGLAIAVDSSGNAYLTGYCYGCGTSGAHAIYTMKFDTNGNHLWTNVTDPTSGTDVGYGIAVDSSGNVYVTGYCDGCGNTGGIAIYTMKLDTNGNHLWTNVTDPTIGSDPGSSIAVDGSGNAYITGHCDGCGTSGGNAIYTFGLGEITSLPTYSNFTSTETINFSAGDVTNITSLTLAIDNKGKIAFPSGHSINAENEDYDTNVKIEDAMIYVNSAALDSSFNDSATLTFYNVDCNNPYVFYSETASTFASILSENQRCLEPLCSNIQCASNTLTVNVLHFTGYAAGTNANLTIEAEAGTFYPSDPIDFYAWYINNTGGTPISGDCNISFDDNWTAEYPMDFNGSEYNYTKSFAAPGTHDYNVTCSNASYVTLEANDTKVVSPTDIPEFSTITLGLGLIAVLGGLIIIRKKK